MSNLRQQYEKAPPQVVGWDAGYGVDQSLNFSTASRQLDFPALVFPVSASDIEDKEFEGVTLIERNKSWYAVGKKAEAMGATYSYSHRSGASYYISSEKEAMLAYLLHQHCPTSENVRLLMAIAPDTYKIAANRRSIEEHYSKNLFKFRVGHCGKKITREFNLEVQVHNQAVLGLKRFTWWLKNLNQLPNKQDAQRITDFMALYPNQTNPDTATTFMVDIGNGTTLLTLAQTINGVKSIQTVTSLNAILKLREISRDFIEERTGSPPTLQEINGFLTDQFPVLFNSSGDSDYCSTERNDLMNSLILHFWSDKGKLGVCKPAFIGFGGGGAKLLEEAIKNFQPPSGSLSRHAGFLLTPEPQNNVVEGLRMVYQEEEDKARAKASVDGTYGAVLIAPTPLIAPSVNGQSGHKVLAVRE